MFNTVMINRHAQFCLPSKFLPNCIAVAFDGESLRIPRIYSIAVAYGEILEASRNIHCCRIL